MGYALLSLLNALNQWKIQFNGIKFYPLSLNQQQKKLAFKKKKVYCINKKEKQLYYVIHQQNQINKLWALLITSLQK